MVEPAGAGAVFSVACVEQMLVQRPPGRHVENLHATAYSEYRNVSSHCFPRQNQLELIA